MDEFLAMPVPSKRDFFVAVPQAGNRCNEPFFQGPRPRLASPPLPLTVVVDNAVAARREGLAAPDPTPAQPAPLPPPPPPASPAPPWRLPPRPSSSLSLKPRPSKRVLEDYRHLPLRKVDPEMFDVGAFPKMSPKPFDSPSFQRACKARTPDERCEGRRECLDDDDHVPVDVKREIPWDLRGPPGPKQGGPTSHKRQKYREGSQRWANAGGTFREMWAKFYALQRKGKRGAELQHWHPWEKDGHWARIAKDKGQLAPYEMKAIMDQNKKQQLEENKYQQLPQEQEEQLGSNSSASNSHLKEEDAIQGF